MKAIKEKTRSRFAGLLPQAILGLLLLVPFAFTESPARAQAGDGLFVPVDYYTRQRPARRPLDRSHDADRNEVKVNVLNQPYAGFPWVDLPQKANENWHNAHNFYGELQDLEAASS